MMTEPQSRQSLFRPSEWTQELLGKIGLSPDPGGTGPRAALILVAVVLLPPFMLSVWRGTAWGSAVDVPFLWDFASIARLAVVVPLLVVASSAIGAQLNAAMKYLEVASLVPDSDRADYEDAKADVERRVRSPAVTVLLLVGAFVAAVILVLARPDQELAGPTSWMFDVEGGIALSPGGWWYTLISGPLVAFFFLLWAWRYVCWCVYLRRLGRMDLSILAAHPDSVGGLAPLVRAHLSFVLVATALNASLSGALANDLLHGGATIADIRSQVAFYLVVSVLLIALPLAVFVRGLTRAKERGIIQYGRLAMDLTLDYDSRWQDSDAKLLDTADPSAMADFGGDYDLVQQMKVYPLGLRQAMVAGVTLFVPFAFLALTQVSLSELVKGLIEKAL